MTFYNSNSGGAGFSPMTNPYSQMSSNLSNAQQNGGGQLTPQQISAIMTMRAAMQSPGGQQPNAPQSNVPSPPGGGTGGAGMTPQQMQAAQSQQQSAMATQAQATAAPAAVGQAGNNMMASNQNAQLLQQLRARLAAGNNIDTAMTPPPGGAPAGMPGMPPGMPMPAAGAMPPPAGAPNPNAGNAGVGNVGNFMGSGQPNWWANNNGLGMFGGQQ